MDHQRIARSLSQITQEALFCHITGPVAVGDRDNNADRVRGALRQRRLIRYDNPQAFRPKFTVITEDGRQVAAFALADYAEQLIAAGYLERQCLPFLPSGQLAPVPKVAEPVTCP